MAAVKKRKTSYLLWKMLLSLYMLFLHASCCITWHNMCIGIGLFWTKNVF